MKGEGVARDSEVEALAREAGAGARFAAFFAAERAVAATGLEDAVVSSTLAAFRTFDFRTVHANVPLLEALAERLEAECWRRADASRAESDPSLEESRRYLSAVRAVRAASIVNPVQAAVESIAEAQKVLIPAEADAFLEQAKVRIKKGAASLWSE